ncbi:MAG: tetratricopeptide repeat protein [Myxococcales bacterium]|nr:tetratricopeptide repeat protein [Myxococcales bacterium]
MRHFFVITFLSLCLATTAVAAPPTSRPTATKPPMTHLEIDPMLLRAKDGKVRTIQQLDLRELYLAAAKAYKLKKYDDAIKLYQVIRTYYPMHNYIFAALYNEALAHEDKGDHNAAIKLYLEVVQHHAKHTQLALNARFRLAACYGKQKQWQKAFQLYDALLQGNLSDEDRIDALAYAGEALFFLRQFDQAQPLLRLAVALHSRKEAPLGKINYAAAMAHYYWARIYHTRFTERVFHLPQNKMKEDLDDKARNLLRAQRLYLQTIKLRHAEWALAAVYQIGKMYEEMYEAMMKAPIPTELNKEEKAIYVQELRKKIKILLDKALVTYFRNLQLAQRIGMDQADWKQRTNQRFQQLLLFYTRSFGQPPLLQKAQSKKQKAQPPKPTSRPASRAATSQPKK